MTSPPSGEPGTLVISFDTELIWGSFDHASAGAFERRFPDERGTIAALLGLLDRHEVAATWAVVGHLFLSECRRGPRGDAHPELIHPGQSRRHGDWLDADPCTDITRDPLWYGVDVLDAIQSARTPQEIGCHSFSHPVFDDPAFAEDAARSEIEACGSLARARGIELRSFVFPRNREAHHAVLRDAGFTAFRGRDPVWYVGLPGVLSRAGHLLDQAAAISPPVARPIEHFPGLWNIPGSMMLLHRAGLRRAMTAGARLAKVRRGLAKAADSGAVFHLWTHPFNVAGDRRALLEAIDVVFDDAARLRDTGRLRIETMGALARRLSAERNAPHDAPVVSSPP